MSLLEQVAGVLVVLAAAPLVVWAERRVKAWAQLRRGPGILQPYRDLRRTWIKQPLAPAGASRFYRLAPILSAGAVVAALFVLPWGDPDLRIAGPAGLLVLGLLLTLQRAVLSVQAYDTGTPFGGLGASRELFLGGLGEPVFLLIAAAVFLQTGSAAIPARPLAFGPEALLLAAALATLWVAESARIPFDNPATHLELTMVHEALILEASGWILALHELAAAWKQVVVASLLLFLFVPLPASGLPRIGALLLGLLALSAALALVESVIAKVRLFRASHLLVAGALLAFLAGAVTFLQGAFA